MPTHKPRASPRRRLVGHAGRKPGPFRVSPRARLPRLDRSGRISRARSRDGAMPQPPSSSTSRPRPTPPPQPSACLRRPRGTRPPSSSSYDYSTQTQSSWSSPTTSLPLDYRVCTPSSCSFTHHRDVFPADLKMNLLALDAQRTSQQG